MPRGCLPGHGAVCLDGRSGQGLSAQRVGVSTQGVCLPRAPVSAREGVSAWGGMSAQGCLPDTAL